MEEIVNLLKINNKTVATMESCTGGKIANAITDVEGASNVFKFSAITYSNEYKVKMGVREDIIEKYTVYSMETAKEMSKKISLFADSNYGIGITGTLKKDKNEENIVYVSLYDRDNDAHYNDVLKFFSEGRKKEKQFVLEKVEKLLISVIKKTNL